MKKKLVVILGLIATTSFASELKDLNSMIGHTNQSKLVRELNQFIKASRPNRVPGQKGHIAARNYLIDKIKKIDSKGSGTLINDSFTVNSQKVVARYQNDFEEKVARRFAPNSTVYQKWNRFTNSVVRALKSYDGTTGHNLIWEKRGKKNPNQYLVIGAGYDTAIINQQSMTLELKGRMPGADNNGTGVLLALKLIESLSKQDIPMSVRVVFFDFFELGGMGAEAYLGKYLKDHLEKQTVEGYVDLVMLGHDSKDTDQSKQHYNMKLYYSKATATTYPKESRLAESFRKYGTSYEKVADFALSPTGFEQGNNIHFQREGIPSVVFSQDWEKDLNQKVHTKNDFPETLNYKSFYRNYRYVMAAILSYIFKQ